MASPSVTSIPMDTDQISPAASLWTNTSFTSPNPAITSINTNPISINNPSVTVVLPISTNQQRSDQPVYPSFKPFTTSKVTTTLIPLNVCPTEYCQPAKPSTPAINLLGNTSVQKSKDTFATHLIGDWIIRESSEPFRRKENHASPPIQRLSTQEKKMMPSDSITSCSHSSINVNQWSINEVCSFFERVLGKNCFAPIIKEHLIDGAALLLLKDEHLINIFKMQLGPRLKLLNRINELKKA